MQEAVPYDRDRAAKAILRLEDFGELDPKDRKTLLTYAAALASHLPESLEDLDSADVLEWLERERAIEWKDDLLAVPASERDAFIAIVESRLAAAKRGAMPKDVARDLARSLGLVLPLGVGTQKPEAQVQRIEEILVPFLIAWLWQAKGVERAVAERAVDELAQVLRIEWVTPPRPERLYSSEERFEVGDSLIHPKFGRGTVVSRTGTAIEVRFSAGSRKLAAG